MFALDPGHGIRASIRGLLLVGALASSPALVGVAAWGKGGGRWVGGDGLEHESKNNYFFFSVGLNPEGGRQMLNGGILFGRRTNQHTDNKTNNLGR